MRIGGGDLRDSKKKKRESKEGKNFLSALKQEGMLRGIDRSVLFSSCLSAGSKDGRLSKLGEGV